jgi:hypothetical protein
MERANETLVSLRVRTDRKMPVIGRETSTDSQSFLKIVLIPMEFRGSHLEKSHEDNLKRLIRNRYPRVQVTEPQAVSLLTEDRDSTFFEWIWYHTNSSWEMRWRITAQGQIAHATQIRSGHQHAWSVVDLCDFLFLFLRLGSGWWEEKGYFGDGVIFVDIGTDSLPIFQIPQGAFGRILNPRGGSPDLGYISSDAIQLSDSGRSRASASQNLNPALMGETSIDTVVSLANTLLRNLGHLVDRQHLERDLQSIYSSSLRRGIQKIL